jgi:hypothetical protein
MNLPSRFAVVSLLAAPVQAGGTIAVEYLGNFPPAVTQRMNAAGQIAGDFQYQSITRAMRYDPGVGRIPLEVPAGTTQSIGIGINAAGAVAGRISHPTLGTVGATWSASGAITTLPAPPGSWSYSTAVAINDAGTVAGYATLAQVGTDPQQAWRYLRKGGYQLLPSLGGAVSVLRDLDSAGRAVGHSEYAANLFRAVIWQVDGTVTDLGPVAGSTQTFGLAMNDAGVVVGTTAANANAIAYRPGSGWQVLPDFGFKAVAYDVNASGWIAGWADAAPFETHPAVWDPSGAVHDLVDLVDPSRFYFPGDFSIPVALSDANVIAVYGMDFTVSGDPRVLLFRVGFPCPADLDGDGAVGPGDLTSLLGAWGGAAGDLDGDGTTGPSDLAALLGAWGSCG